MSFHYEEWHFRKKLWNIPFSCSFLRFWCSFFAFWTRRCCSWSWFFNLVFSLLILILFSGFHDGKWVKMLVFEEKLNIFDKKQDKLITWDPFLLSFDNFSCFNKVELIRLISVFEFCSSRVAAASVWPKILENILKILLVKENIGQMICEILQREKYVSLYLYLTHEWPPEWRMKYDSYDFFRWR